MKNIINILEVIKNNTLNFKVIAPYQENPADFQEGYCTVINIGKYPQTNTGEHYQGDTLTYNQVYREDFRIYFYKYIDYSDDKTADKAAQHLRLWLGSGDSMREFVKKGLNIAPLFSAINIDNYRDNDLNKYVGCVYFDISFYTNEIITIKSAPFKKFDITSRTI